MNIFISSAVVNAPAHTPDPSCLALLSKIVSWFNDNQGFCMILLTIGLVYFSFRACKIAAKNTKAMREIEQERNRPYVMLKTGLAAPCYYKISLVNLGKSPAYDVVVKSKPNFCATFASEARTPIYFLNNKLASIGPGGELSCMLGVCRNKGDSPKYEGEIEYRDSDGRIYNDVFVVDYSIYGKKGDTFPTESMMNDVATCLCRINDTLRTMRKL